ncbi:MAG: aminopeptidase P family protein [Spirochaetaceae bacterium]|jgi:Xaa-Pro aminopeptidase|nr:aminopeptidase P family protein [Spirochaetaceae bacterium]
MSGLELQNMQKAIRDEGLEGWLFCNFHHRDKLSDEILRIDPQATNSRRWVYGVPAHGEPLGIVHVIEPDILRDLPGSRVSYLSGEDFFTALAPFAGKRWGVHSSESLCSISYLDRGTASTLEKAGLTLTSAAALIQRFKGLLDEKSIESHERAVSGLYQIVEIAWERVKRSYAEKESLHEGDIRRLMLEEMKKRGLITDHPPIVAGGVNSGNPHYDFSGAGAVFNTGDVIQFDLWAQEAAAGSVYGDISWVGVYAPQGPAPVEKAFGDLIRAREGVLDFITNELQAGRRLTGARTDQKTREFLIEKGYGEAIKHRTGHGIDTECHGSGVNIDSVEFPDSRFLLEGSCFSLEPGIYFSDYGLRTEIDVYIRQGKPVVSGGAAPRQFTLLTCEAFPKLQLLGKQP